MTKLEVLADAKKILADLVFNMTAHEGNPMTQPEVHTVVVDGITVGGYKISDSEQVSNIALGWRELIRLVESSEFAVDEKTIIHLHGVYAKNEALTWGEFRERQVMISGTEHRPPQHSELNDLFAEMVADYEETTDKDDASYDLFLTCAQNQYFNDGNKRAGQYLMNGSRLMRGLPVITIAARKSADYNAKMIRFYDTGERDEMKAFLKECRVNVQPPKAISNPSSRKR
jgi:Fic family protein